jgi:hypothetical protein
MAGLCSPRSSSENPCRPARAVEVVADLTLENRLLKKSMIADGGDGAWALSHLARRGSLAAPCRLAKPLNLLNPSLAVRQVVSSKNG